MVVVHSSVLVGALLRHGQTRERLAEEELHAPHLLDSEVTSALRGLVLGNRLDAGTAGRALVGLQSASLTRHPAGPMTERVWGLRANLSAYDALYIALAERLGCPLLTADARIARAPGLRCPVDVLP
ncbi:PIN domain-containing protein [Microlunatus spumicola]|uniref:Ribonuclease VapC n=1 Tax=Microlunatus spumicola TaxID=81499 RepID=A0ABP6WX36_9ACTN